MDRKEGLGLTVVGDLSEPMGYSPNRRVPDGARERAAAPTAAAASPSHRPAMGKYDETVRNSKELDSKTVWGKGFLTLI